MNPGAEAWECGVIWKIVINGAKVSTKHVATEMYC